MSTHSLVHRMEICLLIDPEAKDQEIAVSGQIDCRQDTTKSIGTALAVKLGLHYQCE